MATENGDQNAQTPPNGETPPAGTPPAATDTKTPPAGASDEQVTISKKELEGLQKSQKDFQSAADKARNENAANSDFVLTLAKEREIDDFIGKNAEKFPDVTREDLMYLDDPDKLEAEATRLQKRFDDIVQAKLLNVGQQEPPKLSEADKAKELKELKKNPKKGGFQRFLALQQR